MKECLEKVGSCLFKYINGDSETFLDGLIYNLQTLQAWSGGYKPSLIISRKRYKELEYNLQIQNLEMNDFFGYYVFVLDSDSDEILISTIREVKITENDIWSMKIKDLDYNVWNIKVKSEDTNLNIEKEMFFDKIIKKEDIETLIMNKYKNHGEVSFLVKMKEGKEYGR